MIVVFMVYRNRSETLFGYFALPFSLVSQESSTVLGVALAK